jgi:hypothetical protein
MEEVVNTSYFTRKIKNKLKVLKIPQTRENIDVVRDFTV